MTNRDTYVYRLKRKRKTVYIGTTKKPSAREKQHKKSGKRFTHMTVEPYPCNQRTARNKEVQKLRNYRNNHKGKNPKYNKTKTG